ncbi:MAG: DUF1524 domain-containing protein [Actinobacteria bacterium]|nr:DUF1524 domain-containing protein [Actinomycetota bacterium]MCG2802621.1 DUF1524 domain-containing protein [Cellulomonas sp.]
MGVGGAIAGPSTSTTSPHPSVNPTTSTPSPAAEDLADADDPTLNSAAAAKLAAPAPAGTADTDAVLAGAEGQSALVAVAALTVTDPATASGYDRDLFGYRAVDLDKNGCDTRNDILARDLTATTAKAGTNDCVVTTGTLTDPYSGTTIAFHRGSDTSADVQIDHVVSLQNAWLSGASTWDTTRRQQLGNDPLNLLAVSGPLSAQKSDKDAASWLPPNTGYRCQYVARQVAVKYTYSLTITTAERAAIVAVLSTCPTQPLPAGSALPPAVVHTTPTPVAAAPAPAEPAPAAPAPADPAPAAEEPAPAPADAGLDPRFDTCKKAKAAGYGPYVKGIDPEYDWYRDADHDGTDCE